jgi:putative transposase
MIRSLPSLCLRFFISRTQLLLEIVYLRRQLEILARTTAKPRLRPSDRLFFSILTDVFISWKETLLIIKPETVVRWHQQGFKVYWRWKNRSALGRPRIPQEQIDLIKQIAGDKPLWGAPRIHGEILKLGLDIAEATVQRYLPRKPKRTTGQAWKTFLKNHSSEIISLDFFVVPTITFPLVHVLVFLSHHRRKIIHFNVTDHPTSEWASQQLRNAFCDELPLKFLIRDRDSKFGEAFTHSVEALGIRPILTAYRSPWRDGYVERVIGSIRRECLDHVIIANESHLRGILQSYLRYYNTQRTHLAVSKDSPDPREVQAHGEIEKVAVVNGLHHYYFREAA